MKASGKLANRSLFASITLVIFLLVIGDQDKGASGPLQT